MFLGYWIASHHCSMPLLLLPFLQAYKLGMYGADYAWILHEIVGPPWWKGGTHECNQKQLREASENLLVVSSHNSIVGGAISYSGLVRHKTFIFEFVL